MPTINSIKSACNGLIFFSLFLNANVLYGQTEKNFQLNYTLGITHYSYLNDVVFRSNTANSYPKSIITAPTFGLDLYAKNWNLGAESYFYTAFTPSTDNLFVFPYVKNLWSGGLYYRFYNFKVALFYSTVDNRNSLVFYTSQSPYITFERGIGLSFGYTLGNTDIAGR